MFNNYKKLKQYVYDPGFDRGYTGVDKHGIPGKTLESSYDPGFDRGYTGVDKHGIPGKTLETSYDPGFDRGYTEVDRHGLGAVYFPDRETFGTNNREIQEFCENMIDANKILPLGYEMLESLSEKAVKAIIQARYIKSINKLESGYIYNDIAKRIAVDLEIIYKMLLSGKNLYAYDINISNRLGGQDFQNIIGVLDGYSSWLQSTELESRMSLLDFIEKIKEQAIAQIGMLEHIDSHRKR